MTPAEGDNAQPEKTRRTGSGDDKDTLLASPQIRLVGAMDEAMYAEFRNQLDAAPHDGPLVIAITTTGGNPEIARAMADDVRLMRNAGRTIYFLGKAAVYSAGATFMAGFPVDYRFFTKGSGILLHERQIAKTIQLNGPLKSCIAQLKAALHEIRYSIEVEETGFRDIVDGSDVDFEEARGKAPDNWYIPCEEAQRRGLIAGVV